MQLVKVSDAKRIKFRGNEFFISEEDFHSLQVRRADRITGGRNERFKIGDGIVRDYFAERGIRLVEGGEICPTEMSIMVGPMNCASMMLTTMIGKGWYDQDFMAWEPEHV